MDINVLNPFALQEGEVCDTIRIIHHPKDGPKEDVAVALPVEHFPTMQDTATSAYLHAKGTGQLTATMMVVCQFSYRDDAADEWIVFDPADY